MTCYVYRAYNVDSVLLYVGSTIQPEGRIKAHARHSRWWKVATDFTFEPFDVDATARDAELEAIRTEFPRWNIRGRSPYHPDGPATDYRDILTRYPGDCRWGRWGQAA